MTESPISRTEAALARADAGDLEGALSDLEAQIRSEAEEDDAYLALGMLLVRAGRWADALPALAEAVSRDGDAVIARVLYARALEHGGKLDLAIFQMLRAAKLDDTSPGVMRELGSLFYKKGLHDKALGWLAKARLAAGADATEEARDLYATGLVQEARHDPGAAIAAYREAILRNPKNLDARKTLADALAGIGEHVQAIEALDDLLRVDRTNEQAATNREVLERALKEMKAHRLLGKTVKELEISALVQAGQLKRRGRTLFGFGPKEEVKAARYANALSELHVTFDPDRTIAALYLVLLDPEKASREKDSMFAVTVVGKGGASEVANYATAVSLTFLREALGAPLTQAGGLYARLLGGERSVEYGGLEVSFAARTDGDRELHGLLVTTPRRS